MSFREIPAGSQFWPTDFTPTQDSELIAHYYEKGFAGAWRDAEADKLMRAEVEADGGQAFASGIASLVSGAGKLSLLFPIMEKVFPGCLPGPAQQRGDCFAAGTIVFGERTRPIEAVRVGDLVYSGTGKLTKVISTREQISFKPVITVKALGGLPISCTADHRLLVYRLPSVGTTSITRKNYLEAKNKAGKNSRSRVVEAFEQRQAEWIAAGDIRKGDCLLTPLDFEKKSLSDSFADIHAKPDGMWFLGYFVGNGHASGHGVELVSPDPTYIERAECLLLSCGFNPRIDKQRGCLRIRVSSTAFVNWLREQFYDENKTKIYPKWAVGDELFLTGLCDADGHSGNGSCKLDSISQSIAYGAHATLLQLGHNPSVGMLSRSKGTYKNAKPLYRVTWFPSAKREYVWRDERYLVRPVKSCTISEGPTTVYDIGVEDESHSFIANGVIAHNCVSHGSKNAALASLAIEIELGKPDEVTGLVEGMPEIPAEGIKQGALSTEYLYWWRGYNGDGWSCSAAASMIRKHGMLVRKPYPELEIDLTRYSGGLAGKYGSRQPPESIAATGRINVVRTTTEAQSLDEVRDLIASGYGISSCGSEGFSDTRDENGVAARRGSWSHAMAYLGFDDRDVIKSKYNGPLVLVCNSWGTWNKGPRRILGTSIDIPQGCFWARWQDVSRREAIAYSSVAGWPAKKLPDYGFSVLG